MNKIYFSIIAILITMMTSVTAQNTEITIVGHVIDSITREHIRYSAVEIQGTNKSIITDTDGHYSITNAPIGEHSIVVNCLGYGSKVVAIKTTQNNTYTVNFELNTTSTFVDEVVVTGNRYATRKRETSSIVNIISPKLFESTSSVSPKDVLNFQPGARVDATCGNCGTPELRINGMAGAYTQILMDGKPLISSLGSVYGLEQMPAAMIERIEVIRGGGSALYGSSAVAGILNIITKEPAKNFVELSNITGLIGGEALDVNTSINASIITKDRKTGAYIFGMIRNRDAYDREVENSIYPDGLDGFTEIPELESQTIGFRAFHKLTKYSKLTAEYHHIHEYRRGGNELELPPHEADVAEELDHLIDGGSISYDYYSPSGDDMISAYVSAQKISRNSYFGGGLWNNGRPDSWEDGAINTSALAAYGYSDDLSVGAGAQWVRTVAKCLFMPSFFTAGLDYNYNDLSDMMVGYNRDLGQTTKVVGLYAQNEWKVEKFSLLLGGRLDFNNMLDKPIFSPRANIRYAPSKSITFRASYAKGYRAPQLYNEDLHVNAVGGSLVMIESVDDLKAEHSNSFNLSADYWVHINNWQLNFLAEGFYTHLKDAFTTRPDQSKDSQQPDSPYTDSTYDIIYEERYNEDGAYVAGITLEARIAYFDKFNIQAGFTHQKNRFDNSIDYLSGTEEDPKVSLATDRALRSPDNYGYFTLNYKPLRPLSLSTSLTYTGSMLVEHVVPMDAYDDFQYIDTERFLEIDLRAAYDFNLTKETKLQLSIAGKNLLDSFQSNLDEGASKDAGFIYGPLMPRTFYIGAKLTF